MTQKPETATKSKEPLSATDAAFIAAFRQADEETQNLIVDILRGKIDVAVSISVLR
ncbi:hypothetical protein [Nitrobacter sp.]|jgi:hypothetical protein|uniref:hypothetical protein n=1 Tax=Nitrobacter sp. TaxID=29420 RepID=UPI0029CAC46C|nr:hypothetical protein [Nitrobacter sp.]